MRYMRWTPDDIASMTPFQQMVFFNHLQEGSRVLHFDTEEDFLEWQMTTRRSR